MGVAVGDYDGDGDLDLYVTNFGPNVFYRNNGDGTFTDVTKETGTDDPRWSTERVLRRLRQRRRPRPGFRQLHRFHHHQQQAVHRTPPAHATTARQPCIIRCPTRLFRNEGNGKFTDVSTKAGLGEAFGNGLGSHLRRSRQRRLGRHLRGQRRHGQSALAKQSATELLKTRR